MDDQPVPSPSGWGPVDRCGELEDPGGGRERGRPSRRGVLGLALGSLMAFLGVARARPLGASRAAVAARERSRGHTDLTRPAGGRARPPSHRQEPGYPIADLADVPEGGALKASYRGQPVLVLNVDGDIRVFSAICSHEGCLADWNANLGIIHCPCHDGRFGVEGEVISGPPPAPLIRFESRVEEGKVFIVEG